MTTLTIKVNNRTKKGKQLLYLIGKLASDSNLLTIEKTPNAETLEAMKEAEQGNGKEYASIDELFRDLGI